MSAATTIRVDEWFQGPTGFGQGGWTSQRMAAALGESVTVAIKAPIPLETDLEIVARPDVARPNEWWLVDPAVPDRPVLIATSWEPDTVDTAPVSIADAALAGARFPLHDDHPVPFCFSCGRQPNGMQVHAGSLGDGRWASDWTVPWWAIDDDGAVDEGALWAAIDCTQAWYSGLEGGRRPSVTVQIAVEVLEPLAAGSYSLVAWNGDYDTDWDGRKRGAAGAVFDRDGTCVARSRSFWVATD